MEKIGDGAEAIVYRKKNVIKERVKKSYRIPEIDNKLRKTRTRREAKILQTLMEIKFPSPKLIDSDDEKMIVEMEYLEGHRLRDKLEKSNCKKLSRQVGRIVAKLHDNNIIHGDLTTSNMILKKDNIFIIDFGLSFFSHKAEDKAVDVHLFKQALESKHYKIAEEGWKEFLNGYKTSKNFDETITRLNNVELRGRYKHK